MVRMASRNCVGEEPNTVPGIRRDDVTKGTPTGYHNEYRVGVRPYAMKTRKMTDTHDKLSGDEVLMEGKVRRQRQKRESAV
jgi:TFIIF-interacting CTD phosphatase-like protein